MAERRRRAVGRNDDRQLLLNAIEKSGGDTAFHDLQPIGGEQGNHIGGRIEVLNLYIQAGRFVPAFFDPGIDRNIGDRANCADLDRLLLRECGCH